MYGSKASLVAGPTGRNITTPLSSYRCRVPVVVARNHYLHESAPLLIATGNFGTVCVAMAIPFCVSCGVSTVFGAVSGSDEAWPFGDKRSNYQGTLPTSSSGSVHWWQGAYRWDSFGYIAL
jgi:hypothetical protein